MQSSSNGIWNLKSGNSTNPKFEVNSKAHHFEQATYGFKARKVSNLTL